MGARRNVDSASQGRRQQALRRCARSDERDHVRGDRRTFEIGMPGSGQPLIRLRGDAGRRIRGPEGMQRCDHRVRGDREGQSTAKAYITGCAEWAAYSEQSRNHCRQRNLRSVAQPSRASLTKAVRSRRARFSDLGDELLLRGSRYRFGCCANEFGITRSLTLGRDHHRFNHGISLQTRRSLCDASTNVIGCTHGGRASNLDQFAGPMTIGLVIKHLSWRRARPVPLGLVGLRNRLRDTAEFLRCDSAHAGPILHGRDIGGMRVTCGARFRGVGRLGCRNCSATGSPRSYAAGATRHASRFHRRSVFQVAKKCLPLISILAHFEPRRSPS